MVGEAIRVTAFLILIPTAWVVVSLLLSRLSGWTTLAARYRCDTPIEGETGRFRTGRFGAINYSSCLTFVIGEEGLGIAVAAPFRLSHPPLLIPWTEIHRVEPDGRLYSQRIKLSIGHPTIVRAVLPGWVRYRMPIEMRPPALG